MKANRAPTIVRAIAMMAGVKEVAAPSREISIIVSSSIYDSRSKSMDDDEVIPQDHHRGLENAVSFDRRISKRKNISSGIIESTSDWIGPTSGRRIMRNFPRDNGEASKEFSANIIVAAISMAYRKFVNGNGAQRRMRHMVSAVGCQDCGIRG
ncbi:hypothetical protein MMC24_006570 [Lignoscripta atroalba]|nr:hypothetical protein [Lignoscripta atroalba]